jgi:hypothetical protein
MARTAKAASGANYMLALVVVLSFMFVIAVGCAIMIYNQSQVYRVALEKSKIEAKKYITQEETRSEAYQQLEATGDPTMSSYMKLVAQIRALNLMITGQDGATLAGVKSEVSLLNPRDNQTLVAMVRAALADAEYLRTGLNDERAKSTKLEAELQKAADNLKSSRAAADQTIAELREANNKRQQEYAAYQTAMDKTIADLEKRLVEIKEAAQGENAKLGKENDANIIRITELQKELEKFKKGPDGPQRAPKVRPEFLPDGEVVSILEERSPAGFEGNKAGLVYLSRGRKDRVVPGMTFEVFNRTTGVAADPNDKNRVRGKATVEVMNVNDNNSVARIVRNESGQTVVEGDVIANVVYDPNMKFKFVVFGDFDIDQMGVATTRDTTRVETMIKDWGGIIGKDLNYDTDFLVLGIRPPMPREVPGEVDPMVLKINNEQRKKVEAYDKLEKRAVELAIPILNQNRFLSLVGYYRR